ncbi:MULTISPECIES: DUF6504 family protein [Arthrobacter]|uniref:DUF6504 family protein n=1 Tax=unclassified Arthrobacter TaxID=235627 RepID=UPI0024BBBBA7|nr:DUF6504 family protein [Arthrobacter sp. H35-MC1]MDJ0315955.1 DUF6504 family protein [Arthrobacter sp. H35-MC1]
MGIFSEAITVLTSSDGVPLQLWWREEFYAISADPLCWYERRSWWESEKRVRPGEGVGVVDRQMWRLQVHREEAGQGPAEAAHESLTVDVVRYRPSERWRVIKIYDAVDELFMEEQGGA